MALISLSLYRVQPGFSYFGAGLVYNLVTRVVNQTIPEDLVQSWTPINSAGNASLPGLGFLYTKVTFKQPGLGQEAYVMQTVGQILNAVNAAD